MALISFNFAYFLGGQTRKGIKRMGWTVKDVGWDREGRERDRSKGRDCDLY